MSVSGVRLEAQSTGSGSQQVSSSGVGVGVSSVGVGLGVSVGLGVRVGVGLGERGDGFDGVCGSVGELGVGVGRSEALGRGFGAFGSCGASLVRPCGLGVFAVAVDDGAVFGEGGSGWSDRPRRSPLTSSVGSTRLLVPGDVERPSGPVGGSEPAWS